MRTLRFGDVSVEVSDEDFNRAMTEVFGASSSEIEAALVHMRNYSKYIGMMSQNYHAHMALAIQPPIAQEPMDAIFGCLL